MLASLLLLAGVAGDRYGRRRVFRIGLVGFAVGSLLCSLAPTIGALIAARFVQAIGGSMLNPSALSIISQVFAERTERARALGVWGAVVGASMALGPPLGGILIETVGWRSAAMGFVSTSPRARRDAEGQLSGPEESASPACQSCPPSSRLP